MINIIIPYDEKQEGLIRCLNSVKRQRLAGAQVIVCAETISPELIEKYELQVVLVKSGEKYKGLNEAINRASGEYVLFLNPTAILNPFTLEKLIEDNQEGKLNCAAVCKANVTQYPAYEDLGDTVQGRLFSLNIIKEQGIPFKEDYAHAEALFLAEYMAAAKTEEIVTVEGAFIYEENGEWKAVPEDKDYECGWTAHLVALSALEEPAKTAFLEDRLPKLLKKPSFEMEQMFAVETCMHERYALIDLFAKNCLARQWQSAVKEKNAEAFENVRGFLGKYEEEPQFFLHLLQLCGLDSTKYDYIKENDCSNEVFLIETDPAGAERILENDVTGPVIKVLQQVQEENKALKSQMSEISRQLQESNSHLEQVIRSAQTAVPAANPMEYVGPQLADFTIQNYAEGKLGLKTIFKSLGAWLKNKFRK